MATGYVIKILEELAPDLPRHKFGGLPDGMLLNDVGECIVCRHPLHSFFQLDLTDRKLRSAIVGLTYLPIMGCLNCDSLHVAPLSYRVRASGSSIEVVHQSKGKQTGGFPPILRERKIVFAPMDRPWTAEDHKKHQLGGAPFWIEKESRPLCAVCGTKMAFIASVDSDQDVGIAFKNQGMLYAFLCPQCHLISTFGQSPL